MRVSAFSSFYSFAAFVFSNVLVSVQLLLPPYSSQWSVPIDHLISLLIQNRLHSVSSTIIEDELPDSIALSIWSSNSL